MRLHTWLRLLLVLAAGCGGGSSPSAVPSDPEAPRIQPIANQLTNAGVPVEFTVTAVVPGGGTAVWSAASATIPASAFDAGTGAFSWRPADADIGGSPHLVTFTAARPDDESRRSSMSVVIHVRPRNRPPALASLGAREIKPGQVVSFTVAATDPDPQTQFTFSARGDAPLVAAFNPRTGVFAWTAPPSLAPGTRLQMTITVSDNDPVDPQTAEEVFALEVIPLHSAPGTPVITSPVPDGVEGIAATDVHMETAPFDDADGDLHLASEWEIWDVGLEERVWAGTTTDLELTHAHLDDGRFEGAASRGLEFDRDYRLRVRFRDGSGHAETEWSPWSAWRSFRTAPFGISPLRTAGVVDTQPPAWTTDGPLAVPAGVAGVLAGVRSPPDGLLYPLLEWHVVADGLEIVTAEPMAEAAPVVLVLLNPGVQAVTLPPSTLNVAIADAGGSAIASPGGGEAARARTVHIYLPAVELAPDQSVSFWIAANGASFHRLPEDEEPTFARVARETEEAWLVADGFAVDEVLDGLTFPTAIRFVPSPSADPNAPLYYVLGLKGTIWVVNGRGEASVYADGLLNYTSGPPTGNAGQTGLGGFAVEPATGDLIVTGTYRSPAPPQTWAVSTTPPGLTLSLFSRANWWAILPRHRTVRYRGLDGEGLGRWTISARVDFPVHHGHGVARQTGSTAFGLVAYGDSGHAVFLSLQTRRRAVEVITGSEAQSLIVRPWAADDGWLRLSYDGGSLRFESRREGDNWEEVHTLEALPFVPTRIGVFGRNAGDLVASARFTEIEIDGVRLDPAALDDDTVLVSGTLLRNHILRLSSDDGGRTADVERIATVLDMPNDLSHESHQVQDVEFLADGTMLVSVGDGFYALAGQDPARFTGKLLRLNPDGSAPADNPFYDPAAPSAAHSYTWVSGVRNVFDMAVRRSDGRVFCAENGPNRDRIFSPEPGWNMGYDGTDNSMGTHAIFTWRPAIAPVGIEVMQNEAFPAAFRDWIFMGSAGADFVTGASKTGKRILAMDIDPAGTLHRGPVEFLRYQGSGKATPIGLAFGPDGLYVTTLYNTDPAGNPLANARVIRIRPQ